MPASPGRPLGGAPRLFEYQPYVVMAISPDGGTLFLAGTNHIAVMPAP